MIPNVTAPTRSVSAGLGYTLNPAYKVKLIDRDTGKQKAEFDNWRILYFGDRVNGIGWYQFAIDGLDSRKELFRLDDFVEIWRSDIYSGLNWYRELLGMHRTSVHHIFDNGNTQYSSYGRTANDMLNRRIIAYRTGSGYADKSGPAEEVMKEFVYENAGAGATSPPRLLDGVISGLTVQGTGTGGDTWSGGRAGENLFALLQNIAESTGVDFLLVPTGYGTWEFRTYPNQLGTDRTYDPQAQGNVTPGRAPVVFSVQRANMSDPVLSYNRTEEVNTVFVWGPGEEEDRLVEIVEDDVSAIETSPWNQMEMSVSANGQETSDELIALGWETIFERRPRFDINFNPIQQKSLVYGRDYFLGDRVSAAFPGVKEIDVVTNKKIIAVTINISGGDEGGEGREDIRLDLADTIKKFG